MSAINKILSGNMKLIKHYIKDLSFENFSEKNVENFQPKNHKISHNIDFIYQSQDKDTFSILINYNCNLVSKTFHKNIFILELVYFGLFEIEDKTKLNQDILTKNALKKLYPYVKSIVEFITQNGCSIKVTLDDINFDLLKKTNT